MTEGAIRVGRLAGVALALTATGREHESAEFVLKRRVVPLALVLLFVVVGAHLLGEQLGLYPSWMVVLLRLAVGAAAIGAAAAWAVRLMRAAEADRADLGGRYQQLVEQLPLTIYIDEVADNSANIYTSPQLEQILGYTVEEWVDDPDLFVKTLHPEDRDRVLRQVKESNAAAVPFRCEYRLVGKEGQVVWFRDESLPVLDEQGTPLYIQGYLVDITERKRSEEQLAQLAYTDTLTGLANREHFLREMEAELGKGRDDVSIVFLDLDDFKTVNDSLGHAAGDELLRVVATRLAAAVRETDLVARLGGDEFAILVRTAERSSLERLTERIQLALRSTTTIGGNTLRTAASIGIARGPDSSDLLRDADVAMYAAKDAGGDATRFFESQMHEGVVDRLEMMGALQRPEILEELRLDYQPTFDLTTGQARTVEALLRWERPGRGTVPPAQFIPVAEQTGAILTIGRWVLDEACRQVALWNEGRTEQPLTLNVNLSGRQLACPELITDVASAVARSGLPAELLTLELSETVLMTSEGIAAENLRQLKRLGVRLAIDDFGTGYSSFSYLRRLAVDVIKIDRSFIAELDSSVDRLLVRGMVQLAHALGIELVAEGIEREEQISFLRELRCQHGQGFLLAEPLAPTELEALLAADRPEALRLRVVGG